MSELVPDAFRAAVAGRAAEGDGAGGPGEDGDRWLRRLPRLVGELLEQWQLEPDGPSRHGVCALVVPVRQARTEAALKVTWPHDEARYEHLALRAWDGDGAVRLLAADPARWGLLLERLDADRDLHSRPLDEACAVAGDLLSHLDRPALPQLPRLSDWARTLVAQLPAGPEGIPRRFVEQARSLATDLAQETTTDARLVHTDLHYANVLAAGRTPWLAIDPKPMAADPGFAVAPLLWNRWDEVVASHDARRHLRRRLSLVCEHAGLDEDRTRAWTLVREVEQARWAARSDDPAGLTTAVTVIKAMAD